MLVCTFFFEIIHANCKSSSKTLVYLKNNFLHLFVSLNLQLNYRLLLSLVNILISKQGNICLGLMLLMDSVCGSLWVPATPLECYCQSPILE